MSAWLAVPTTGKFCQVIVDMDYFLAGKDQQLTNQPND